jgi:hypothetical protein
MFTNDANNFIKVDLSTTLYLGRKEIAERFCDILTKYNDAYLPDRWDIEQRSRLRRQFSPSTRAELIAEWTRPEDWKSINFSRKSPFRLEMSMDIKRFAAAKFNEFSAYIHENCCTPRERQQQLLNFITEISSLIRTDYGFIAHKRQERRQSPVLTPAERLPGVYWANLFGRPYIDFFGREKLLATPCYGVREVNKDLILIVTSNSINSSEMIEGDEVTNRVKAYLDQGAFAGPNFPHERCAVPDFDFADVRGQTNLDVKTRPDEDLSRLQAELEDKGFKLIREDDGRLIFQGHDNAVVVVDRERAEISVDLSK